MQSVFRWKKLSAINLMSTTFSAPFSKVGKTFSECKFFSRLQENLQRHKDLISITYVKHRNGQHLQKFMLCRTHLQNMFTKQIAVLMSKKLKKSFFNRSKLSPSPNLILENQNWFKKGLSSGSNGFEFFKTHQNRLWDANVRFEPAIITEKLL